MTDIAKAYGSAIFELAIEDKCDKQILEELIQLDEVFTQTPTYLSLLSAPTLKKEERIDLISQAFKEHLHEYVLNFLKILCEKGYLAQFHSCVQEYQNCYNFAYNIVTAVATSAVPLTDEQQNKLTEKLCALTGKHIQLTFNIDANIIGGISLKIEDNQFDGSIKNRLDVLRANLLSTLA